MQKFCPSAFQRQLEANRTPRMTRCFTSRLTLSPSKLKAKPACAEHLCLSGSTNPLSNCCSHNPSPVESSNNNKMCVWICVMFMWLWLWLWMWLWMCVCCYCGGCHCRGHGQCCDCLVCVCVFGCCVSIVVCTCESFALEHNDFVAFIH